MDIDNFKPVVDTLGHLNGSRALREVAGKIKKCLTAPAFGVAYGGDEFVVVLPETGRREAIQKAGQIRHLLKQSTLLTDWNHQVRLTASFGVATFDGSIQQDISQEKLIKQADRRLYQAKEEGRNRVRGAC